MSARVSGYHQAAIRSGRAGQMPAEVGAYEWGVGCFTFHSLVAAFPAMPPVRPPPSASYIRSAHQGHASSLQHFATDPCCGPGLLLSWDFL